MILAIDPGSRKAGVAAFGDDGTLAKAWLAEGEDWIKTTDAILDNLPKSAVLFQHVAIEKMQIYKDTPLAHANDCITLSLMAGRVTGVMRRCYVHTYTPNAWKGQVPKGIMVERIKGKLTKDEHRRVELPKAKSLQHNVWDAIGIGLHCLKKMKGVKE